MFAGRLRPCLPGEHRLSRARDRRCSPTWPRPGRAEGERRVHYAGRRPRSGRDLRCRGVRVGAGPCMKLGMLDRRTRRWSFGFRPDRRHGDGVPAAEPCSDHDWRHEGLHEGVAPRRIQRTSHTMTSLRSGAGVRYSGHDDSTRTRVIRLGPLRTNDLSPTRTSV